MSNVATSAAADDNDEARLHSIRLRVLGLTGITVDGETDPAPKQMRAIVAATRDSASYGFSTPSRRLVKAPRNEQFIAIWTSGNNSNPSIEFETAIEPQLRRSLHRNFELVIGVASSKSIQPTPIGAASLPLQQAVALRSRDTGKIVLDLPVFNLASSSLKGDPFHIDSKTPDDDVCFCTTTSQKPTGLFRSRSMRHQRSAGASTTASSSVATLSPSWKTPSEATAPQNPFPYRMDPGRDAAILRIELEIHEVYPDGNRSVVLVQPQDDAIEAAHTIPSSELLQRHNYRQQYRVKIVDQTTMDCELAQVKLNIIPSEDDSAAPTLASTSGELSSVENLLYIGPDAVERVLSDERTKPVKEDPSNDNDEKPAHDTIGMKKDAGVEMPLERPQENTPGRKPSLFRILPRIRSRSVPSTLASAVEKSTSNNATGIVALESDSNARTTEMTARTTEKPQKETIPSRVQSSLLQSNEIPSMVEGQTAAPETFEPTPVHFSHRHFSDNIQFNLAMNMTNVPPQIKKKIHEEQSIPLGTILCAPKQGDTDVDATPTDNSVGFASSVQQRLKSMFTVNEEEEEDRSVSDEDTIEESFRRPALRDDLVDLVAAFGDMCRPMNAAALEDSYIEEAPHWTGDDDMLPGEENDISDDDEESNASDDLFGDIQHEEGTEIDVSHVDVSKAVPLRTSSRLFLRKRRSRLQSFVRDEQPAQAIEDLPLSQTPSTPEPKLDPAPPKKLVSVLKNGTTKSPIRPYQDTDDPMNGSPTCVSQPPVPPSFMNPMSMAQNFVDFVAKAIASTAPKEEEEQFPVPSVFLEARDTVSVGDLTATSHEMQIDLNEFKRIIAEHLEQVRDNRTEYMDGNEDMFQLTDSSQLCPTEEDQIIPGDASSWEEFSAM